MYYEIEGQLSINSIVFDENELINGEHRYPYSEIDSLEITSAPLFSTYGILTLKTKDGRSVPIPFARSRKNRLEAALREFGRLRGGVQSGSSEGAKDAGGPGPAAVSDPYEEMKKLKELLDMDIITEEEFERKKKQLLDL